MLNRTHLGLSRNIVEVVTYVEVVTLRLSVEYASELFWNRKDLNAHSVVYPAMWRAFVGTSRHAQDGLLHHRHEKYTLISRIPHLGRGTMPMPQSTHLGRGTRPMPPQRTHLGRGTRPTPQRTHLGRGTRPMPQRTLLGPGTRPMPQSTHLGRGTRPMPQSTLLGRGDRLLQETSCALETGCRQETSCASWQHHLHHHRVQQQPRSDKLLGCGCAAAVVERHLQPSREFLRAAHYRRRWSHPQ